MTTKIFNSLTKSIVIAICMLSVLSCSNSFSNGSSYIYYFPFLAEPIIPLDKESFEERANCKFEIGSEASKIISKLLDKKTKDVSWGIEENNTRLKINLTQLNGDREVYISKHFFISESGINKQFIDKDSRKKLVNVFLSEISNSDECTISDIDRQELNQS